MTIASLRRRRPQRWILALALPWLALRLLLPAGVMPVIADGGMALDLCTPQGLQLPLADADRDGNTLPATHGHDAPCAFAASALAAPPPAAAPLSAAIVATDLTPMRMPPGIAQPSILRA